MARPLQQQIIARALDLISHEARWTSLVIARKADGKTCEWIHPLATRFRAVGALDRAAYELLGTGGAGRLRSVLRSSCLQRMADPMTVFLASTTRKGMR